MSETAQALRVVHCSDIHLECNRKTAEHYQDGLVRVMDEAVRVDADLLLIAGDLFDSNYASDESITWAMQTLESYVLPVVMIPGNHDCLEPGAIFHRYDFDALRGVDMLTAEAGEQRVLPDLNLAVWGKGMVDHSRKFRPLGGVAERPAQVSWYLGLGHGIYVPDGEDTMRSSPVYADDIGTSPFDYIALGHHHAALDVKAGSTAATYSGSPTDLIGQAATYTVIELAEGMPPRVSIEALVEPA